MRVADINSRTERTYTLTIEDGEIREARYSTRKYRIAKVVFVKRDGNPSLAETSGPALKKDGTDSANWCRETFYRPGDFPQCVNELIKGLA